MATSGVIPTGEDEDYSDGWLGRVPKERNLALKKILESGGIDALMNYLKDNKDTLDKEEGFYT